MQKRILTCRQALLLVIKTPFYFLPTHMQQTAHRTSIALLSALFLVLSGILPQLVLPNPGGASHTQCSDAVDNDQDGLSDYPADSDCSSVGVMTEAGTSMQAVTVSLSDGRERVRAGDSLLY